MLNLIEHYDLESEGRSGRNVHRLIEAMKCESSNVSSVVEILTACVQLDLLHGNENPQR